MFKKQFSEVEDACALAQAMVDTVREPLIVLDKDLRVIAASRSFYVKFATNPDDSQGKHLCELGNGEWDIPRLRALLEKIIPDHGTMDDYEVEHDFPHVGRRVLLLNACIVLYEKAHKNILLSIEDLTVQRALEHDKDELLRQKDVLLDEIEHRVANSLQIIASIIMLKAKSVESEETRRHLHDAHNRVISVAAVQRHLHASAGLGSMEMLPYLSTLCGALTHSMIGDGQLVSLKVIGKGGSSTCANAESLGLIVTELVINALKHAFDDKTKDGQITVAYDVSGTDWKLSVADNGVGKPDGVFAQPKSGLGTGIVKALAKQLDSQVATLSGPKGTTVSVTHATFEGRDMRKTCLRPRSSTVPRKVGNSRWSKSMNENDFEAGLLADGYTEIAIERLEPRPAKEQHEHHFAIRGLVLAGSFTVTQDKQSTTYRSGQVFAVADGHPHDESVGPEGARVIIGRKYAV